MERMNLIPASHLLARRRTRRVHAWLVACAAYALLLTVGAIAVHVTLAAEPDRLEHGLTDISHMRDRMQMQLDDLQEERRELAERHAAAIAVGRQPDWSIALRLLAAGPADGIVLSRLELDSIVAGGDQRSLLAEPRQYRISIEGWAVSEPVLAELIRSIEKMGPFTRVRREASTYEKVAGRSVIRFHLLCEIDGGPKEKNK